MSGRGTTRAASAAALAVAVVMAASACGIGNDTEPRALTVSTTTTEPATAPTSGGASAVVYYVLGDTLVPVTRSLPDRETGTVLNALLEAPADLDGLEELTTSIPTGTELQKLTLDGDTLSVDLSDDFENLAGPARQQAIAQIVLTATEFPSIRNVRFSVDGRPIQVTSPTRGDTERVDDCDFAALLPSAEEATADDLDQATIDRLDLRRADLDRRCPRTSTTIP